MYDEAFCENSYQLLAVSYFLKKLHHRRIVSPKCVSIYFQCQLLNVYSNH